MPFIPHTKEEVEQMLDAIGASSIEDLFDEIPDELRNVSLAGVPTQASEMEVGRVMMERSSMDGIPLSFIGAGAYEHHIPAAVWELTTRGEFYTAYTPYQAEASQGTLQLIYEFQTMMSGPINGSTASRRRSSRIASARSEAGASMAIKHRTCNRWFWIMSLRAPAWS